MARIAVVGDGPAGLSAALFLAKNGHETTVYGDDDSLMEYAELHNYLGTPGMTGAQFQDVARRQVEDAGATLATSQALDVQVTGEGFAVNADQQGDAASVDYVVIAGGKDSQELAESLGATMADRAVQVDGDSQTSVDRLYAAGHLVRPERSQAIISAGWGAAAALDIMAREAGRDVHDWDTPED